MQPKDADGMANSIDPDQTASSEAVWSWSALLAETYLSQYIEFIRYIYMYHKLIQIGKQTRRPWGPESLNWVNRPKVY